MLTADEWRSSYHNDSDLLNALSAKLWAESGGGDLVLGPRTYLIDTPVILKTGVRLRGEGTVATCLRATPKLVGPVLISENAFELLKADAWFHDEGVPVRFAVMDLCINAEDAALNDAPWSGCGVFLYGKGFEFRGIEVINAKRHGIVSTGSLRGGQKSWKDEPEAIFDVRVSGCGGDGFLMRGPHDSVIHQAIIARCKGRGLAVECSDKFNGACDIDFCHAYATDSIAIDLAAKVKAGFLQGDTGRGSGVRIAGSNKTYIDRVECFKTRGGSEEFALDINAVYTQIGLARVRADWGSAGVHIRGKGTQIGLLDIDGRRNTGGPKADTDNDTTGLYVSANFVQLPAVNVRNFSKGKGILIADGTRGANISGVTESCYQHIVAEDMHGCDLKFDSLLAANESNLIKSKAMDRVNIRERQGGKITLVH